MMRVVDILIEELVERSPRDFLDHSVQIVGGDIAVTMAFEISLDALSIEILSQLAAQHLQDPTALWIGVEPELILRAAEVATNDGIGIVALVETGLRVLAHDVEEHVPP